MQEGQDVFQTTPLEEESKIKKYARLAISYVLLGLLALVCVMAFLKR